MRLDDILCFLGKNVILRYADYKYNTKNDPFRR